MALWKDGSFVDDAFTTVADDAELDPSAPVIVSIARWRAQRDILFQRPGKLGLLMELGKPFDDIHSDIKRFDVIAVPFSKFSDGRAFSIGRLLRDQHGFKGELRAVGPYIIDQVPLMRRVGFDAFEPTEPLTVEGFKKGYWPEVPEYYQPVKPELEIPAGTRPWARRRAPGHEGP
jgi:phosphoadenosine phosphosulfate reductase